MAPTLAGHFCIFQSSFYIIESSTGLWNITWTYCYYYWNHPCKLAMSGQREISESSRCLRYSTGGMECLHQLDVVWRLEAAVVEYSTGEWCNDAKKNRSLKWSLLQLDDFCGRRKKNNILNLLVSTNPFWLVLVRYFDHYSNWISFSI